MLICVFVGMSTHAFSQQFPSRNDSIMIQKFYETSNQYFYWFLTKKNIKRAGEWLAVIESNKAIRLHVNATQFKTIRNSLQLKTKTDSAYCLKIDKQITAIILEYLKVLQQGSVYFNYDQLSHKRDSVYVLQLLQSNTSEKVIHIVSRLESNDTDYLLLKAFLHDSVSVTDTLKYNAVMQAMDYRKCISILQESEYLVVNIPAANAKLYKNNLLVLQMKTVVGKKKTKTPTIASYIPSIVTFPFWTVPQSIARKEILPKVQKDITYLDKNNFEVVDGYCNPIAVSKSQWNNYNENNFPYYFRQSSGADNAMGVLKFELENPFSVFLHATSNSNVFEREKRFLSHGCIRLEKPLELAEAILVNKIDVKELQNGKKDTKSETFMLPQKLQTFIIYMPVFVENGNVIFLEDVYGIN